jgi:AraC-like DNA-binding protein
VNEGFSDMAKSIPLIRAAVLAPMIRWLRADGRPVRERLQLADLGYVSGDEPELPIPLLSVFEFFRRLAALEGPDIAARVVTENSLADLGNLGRVILGSRTPRDALRRVVAALPRYSTHELISLKPIHGGLCVQAGWSLVLDSETMHLTQQFSAALICGLYAATDRGPAAPRSVRIRAHPVFGIEHLRPIFGAPLAISNEATLSVDLDDDVLDSILLVGGSDLEEAQAEEWDLLKGDSSFSHSARLVLAAMIDEPAASFARLAKASGMHPRSLQRMLTSEGTSFRQLSDELRRERAVRALLANPGAISTAAADIGYAAQSSFSRAVRRWTGSSPKILRPATAPRRETDPK